MSLAKFIDQVNAAEARMATMFRHNSFKQYDIKKLSLDDKEKLAAKLSRELLPECLTCDGTVTGLELKAKARFLYAAKAGLETLGVNVEVYK